jgi:hypothetical protein
MIDTAYADTPRSRVSDADDELLCEIRDRYKSWETVWQKVRQERNIDLRYICGDPWDPKDRKAREDASRPCINHDELGQYVNQCVNSVRQNKRGIKADPRGYGSSEQSALLRQDIIRTIETDCDGPSIYADAFQQMVEGSFAFFRISRRYVSDHYAPPQPEAGPSGGPFDLQARNQSLFHQEIVIKPIGNPNSVLFDPNCKEPDWSDAKACFVLERVPKKEFKRRWPKAQVTDFTWEHGQMAGDWIYEDDVLTAEYWRVELQDKTIYLLDSGEVVDSLPAGQKAGKKRTLQVKKVMQYITNGVEILQRSDEPEPGSILPIIPMIGLQRYLDEGGSSRRVLFSLVRLARDPQMSLAYLNSQEMEEAGLSPKSPWLGYKGQFDSNREMWLNCTKWAYAFLESDIPENWPAGQVPPLPTRIPFTPNFQSYEIAKDSCRRAIQAAMGITPLPTAMQRSNEKSGVAMERIENLEAIGSFHFIDGYDRSLRLAGKVIDQWMPSVYGIERPMHVRKPDDSYRLLKLNTSEPYPDERNPGNLVQYPVEEVDHAISVSTGPSYHSQREAVDSFLESLIGQLPNLPISPPQAAQLLSLAIKMKNMGPRGDEMAEIISPSQGSPDQSLQQLQAAQGQLQQQAALIQMLQAEVQRLTIERQAKVVEGEYKVLTEKMRTDANLLIEKLKVDAQIATAEVQTKSQIVNERIAALDEMYKQSREQVHEASLLDKEHDHDLQMVRQEYLQQALEAANKPAAE